MSAIASLPLGRRTRAASAKTRFLIGERLITPFEITTSKAGVLEGESIDAGVRRTSLGVNPSRSRSRPALSICSSVKSTPTTRPGSTDLDGRHRKHRCRIPRRGRGQSSRGRVRRGRGGSRPGQKTSKLRPGSHPGARSDNRDAARASDLLRSGVLLFSSCDLAAHVLHLGLEDPYDRRASWRRLAARLLPAPSSRPSLSMGELMSTSFSARFAGLAAHCKSRHLALQGLCLRRG